jgi:hypothetical protein
VKSYIILKICEFLRGAFGWWTCNKHKIFRGFRGHNVERYFIGVFKAKN